MQHSFSRGGGGRHSLNFVTRGFLVLALLGGVFLCVEPDAASAAGTPCSITPVMSEVDLNTCIAEAPTDNSEFDITLGANFNLTAQKTIAAGKNITLASINPATPITLTRDPSLVTRLFLINITAPSAATLTIDSVILDGGNQTAINNNQLIFTNGTGDITVNLTGNTVLKNNNTVGLGAAAVIYAASNKLNISDNVQIINNTATDRGGGIFVIGTLTMSGGEISDNPSISAGGGVYVSNSTFIMTGGIISGNTASYGGGVILDNSTFTMSGGTISGNTALAGGGVVAGRNSTFNMTGGTISDNIATVHGGGLNVGSSGVVNISGGLITNNAAAQNGGGLNVDTMGAIIMTGGKITDNTASGLGNGIYFEGNAKSVTLGGNAQIGDSLGSGNGIYLDTDMIVGILSGFAGFANIEGATDAYLGRPVAEGISGYTALDSDVAKFKWLPADFALELNSATSQIVLGAVPEAPGTGLRKSSDGSAAAQSVLAIAVVTLATLLIVLAGQKLSRRQR